MLDPKTVETSLRAGGIVPHTAKPSKTAKVGEVGARAFRHPALAGRVVVRLSTTELAPGVDVEMATLGFDPPETRPSIGFQRYRALGFPGWPLVHDPGKAKFALDVMKELKKAATRVKSKPGHARDAFVAIAEKLSRAVPHFLPSFWEEAGRAFLAEDATSFAAQAFEKARTAEKEHALAVDEDVRASVFLEFALAGAVNAKSLAAYAKELEKGFGAKEGYARFFELTRRRTLGGMPPWSGMAKDLRAFAKQAKESVPLEDERFLKETLDARALALAPADLWTSYEEALVRLAKASPEVRDRVRRFFPKPPRAQEGFAAWWLGVLERAGCFEALFALEGPEAAREAHGMAADWLEKALAWAPHEAALGALVPRLAPRLLAEGVPVQIDQGNRWNSFVSIDATEHALALGVPLKPLGPRPWFDLRASFTVDPVTLAADPRFSTLLATAVGQRMGEATFELACKGKKGLATARRAWIAARVEDARASALPGLSTALEQISKRLSAETLSENPEAREAFAALEPKANLARQLRGGHVSELAFPAFEQAARALGANVSEAGHYPYPVLHSSTKAVVLGYDGPLLEHDLRVPPGARIDEMFFVPTTADGLSGQLFCSYWDPKVAKRLAYFSGTPQELFELETSYFFGNPVRVPGGPGLVFGGRPFVVGDTRLQREGSGVVSDGTRLWAIEHDAGRPFLRELDPSTGQKGARSWPSVFGDVTASSVSVLELHVRPPGSETSLFATKDGLFGHIGSRDASTGVTTYRGVDGAVWTTRRTAEHEPFATGRFRVPGGEGFRILYTTGYGGRGASIVKDEEGLVLGVVGVDPWTFAGWPRAVGPRLWPFLRPRDVEGSKALRAATEDHAQALLDAVKDASIEDVERAVARVFPEISSPELRRGIAATARLASSLAASHQALVKSRVHDVAAGEATSVDDNAVRAALVQLVPATWGEGAFSRSVRAVSDFFEGRTVSELPRSVHSWELLFGRVRALATRFASPASEPELRAACRKVLEVWKDTVFAREPEKVRLVVAKVPISSPINVTSSAGSWLCTVEGSRYFVRSDSSGQLPEGSLRPLRFLEYSTDGTFRLPAGATVDEERKVTDAGPLVDADYLERLLALEDERGRPRWSSEAVARVVERAHVTRAEGILLLAGLPGAQSYASDFLGKEARTVLDLKVGDAKLGKVTLADAYSRVGQILAAQAPHDPAGYWSPLEGADDGFAARVVSSFTRIVGERVAVREDLVALCGKDVSTKISPEVALAALAAPGRAACLAMAPRYTLKVAFVHGALPARAPFDWRVAAGFTYLLPRLMTELAVGEECLRTVPELVQRLRECLLDPVFVAPLRATWGDAKTLEPFFDALGGEAFVNADGVRSRDTGAVLAEYETYTMRVGFRPSKVDRFDMDDPVRKLSDPTGAYAEIAFALEALPAFAARVEKTPVPVGGYEANPLLSAKHVVEGAREKLGLSEGATVLYLQLLALAEPTLKNVVRWNAWKPAQYKDAARELVEAKLVVEGKRERAGREIFLPGGWDKKSGGDTPLETWKLSLFVGPTGKLPWLVPPLPPHAMFEAAFARVARGDVPKFEEV